MWVRALLFWKWITAVLKWTDTLHNWSKFLCTVSQILYYCLAITLGKLSLRLTWLLVDRFFFSTQKSYAQWSLQLEMLMHSKKKKICSWINGKEYMRIMDQWNHSLWTYLNLTTLKFILCVYPKSEAIFYKSSCFHLLDLGIDLAFFLWLLGHCCEAIYFKE